MQGNHIIFAHVLPRQEQKEKTNQGVTPLIYCSYVVTTKESLCRTAKED
ncbi:hypothetical protein HM1_0820 [Heliomicrobium modesticaldum Ice1]|uniref:Uncharacterized protein n=1 Tax=Heliobacterium modesticaldum (strain ATCC 51547 / Ice1) TaxID=498761 RepID=B0TAT5_HELMI|nr:hypothetical protein HM1_0820 [Heliomicrobium modesticaldum Ice1]